MAITYAEGRIKITVNGDDTESDHYLIKSITWTGATNGNALVLQDQDGFDIWVAKAETTHLEMEKSFIPPLPVQQIQTSTLDGGTVYIYI